MKTFKLPYFLALVLSFCLSAQAIGNEGPPPVPVETVQPRVSSIDETINTTGVLKSNSSVNITTEIPGRLISIGFKDGAKVNANQVLFKLDDSLIKTEYAQAQARFENAQLKYQRQEQLVQSGTGNTAARDDALSQLKVEEAQKEYSRAKVDQAEIKAPFEGFVGLTQVEVGDYIVPGTSLVNLEEMHTIKIDFKVPETYLSQVKPKQTIQVKLDGFDTTFKGVVTAIDPSIDPRIHSLSVRGQLDNPDYTLKPGLFARIALVINHRDNALLIPESAIQFSEEGPFVYKIVEGKAHTTQIKPGLRMNGEVEIVEGLQAEDSVVISGQNRLYEGAATYPAQ